MPPYIKTIMLSSYKVINITSNNNIGINYVIWNRNGRGKIKREELSFPYLLKNNACYLWFIKSIPVKITLNIVEL